MRYSLLISLFILMVGCTDLKNQQKLSENIIAGQYVPSAGTYSITLKATAGHKKNAVTKGMLWLSQVDQSMRSNSRLLYGAIDINLDIVDAPICEEDNITPSSRDPLSPGVIVMSYQSSGTDIVIGSPGNKWAPGFAVQDGCGIILHIDQFNDKGFSGHWGPYGIIVAGSGEFEAVLPK